MRNSPDICNKFRQLNDKREPSRPNLYIEREKQKVRQMQTPRQALSQLFHKFYQPVGKEIFLCQCLKIKFKYVRFKKINHFINLK